MSRPAFGATVSMQESIGTRVEYKILIGEPWTLLEYNPPMPTVSVLMPCYNAADTIDESVRSLAFQSFTNFEIVAVDARFPDDP